MIKNHMWVHFAPEILTELAQCADEGLEVEKYRDDAEAVRHLSDAEADRFAELLHSAKHRSAYPFTEPSALPEILAARPENRPVPVAPDADALPDKLRGAWTGRIAGCLAGKPVEGFRRAPLRRLLEATGNFPMRRYICEADFTPELISELGLNPAGCWADTLGGCAPIDDDTNYTVLALDILERYGRDFTPEDVAEEWLSRLPMLATCTAERVAYRNLASGILPPQSAMVRNPYREWIGAQIRGDLYGYVNPGDPERAAEMAFRDASISHVKNGIYGEMFAAALCAQAAVESDTEKLLCAALAQIPAACRLRRDVDRAAEWCAQKGEAEPVFDLIHAAYNEADGHGWCHTDPNAMIVTAALLLGGGDFAKTVGTAVQAGFDTDCNGATSASVLGMVLGEKAIPAEWSAPFGGCLATSIFGSERVSVGELAERTLKLIKI